ncbi:hypothetical protein MNEG_4470 [Monoraphidium neglectum]|uniref:Glutathione S-transferase n=1 Tax=Monoraphidium neglectum TaxID=145388 RepID=A0A0D2NDZ3_9CHLO|nr:hypothetical protein MNEG_4470 [Monoraphidium neglectum]KIZ03486.1 hypothetical protein MNEG_4470 [Monoraphidium neglectum]|eukprot:XP_013902505.1 hypothetical protein MNEG_4470 [Monoraphidium neglectum]
MAIVDPVTFKYLALPNGLAGRGGAVRFFLLAARVPYKEDLVDFAEWRAGVKQEVKDSGESPLGVLPVITVGSKRLIQHVATTRYLAKAQGLYGKDIDADLAADGVADEYVPWREAWVASLGGDDAKATYASARPKYYAGLEALLGYYGSTGASATAGGALTYADALLFSQIWDDTTTQGLDLLQSHQRLLAFFTAFKALPAISEYLGASKA